MAFPKDLLLSEHPNVHRAIEGIASAMFGEAWRDSCSLCDTPGRVPGITLDGDVVLACLPLSAVILRPAGLGLLPNDASGLPAETKFYPDGRVASTTHYKKNRVTDPGDGRPAHIEYYPNGQPQRVQYFNDGEMCDSPVGHPALVAYYPDGRLDYGRSMGPDHNDYLVPDKCRSMTLRAQMRCGLKWATANLPQEADAVGMHIPRSDPPAPEQREPRAISSL